MNMHGTGTIAKTERAQRMEQNNRVTSARQANPKALAGKQTGSEKIADPIRQIS